MKEWCLGFIVSPDGEEVVLLRKTRTMHVGQWNGIGGKIEENESAAGAMVRETKEEAGFPVVWDLACYLRGPVEQDNWRVFVFAGRMDFKDYYNIDLKPRFPDGDKPYRIRRREFKDLPLAPHVSLLTYVCLDKITYPHVNPVQLQEISNP